MRDAEGIGNFRNLFIYARNGKKDGIKIVPLSEVATKDDFFNIKKSSGDDLLSAHCGLLRMRDIILGNMGGFGDIYKAVTSFIRNGLTPQQESVRKLNVINLTKVVQILTNYNYSRFYIFKSALVV